MDARDLWQWKIARFSEILEKLHYEVKASFDCVSVNRFWPSSGPDGEYFVYHVTLFHPEEESELGDFLYHKPEKIKRRRKAQKIDAESEVFIIYLLYY